MASQRRSSRQGDLASLVGRRGQLVDVLFSSHSKVRGTEPVGQAVVLEDSVPGQNVNVRFVSPPEVRETVRAPRPWSLIAVCIAAAA